MKTIFLAAFTLFCSCGTRQTASKVQSEIRRMETVRLGEDTRVNLALTDSFGENRRRERLYCLTTFSAPDSAGRQWPVSIEQGSLIEDYVAARQTTTDSTSVAFRSAQHDLALADKSRLSEKSNLSTRFFPLWVGWLVLLIGALGALGGMRKKKGRG